MQGTSDSIVYVGPSEVPLYCAQFVHPPSDYKDPAPMKAALPYPRHVEHLQPCVAVLQGTDPAHAWNKSCDGEGPRSIAASCQDAQDAEIIRLELQAGITKQKCATLAEAEMIAECGATDVLLAYPIVGPNAGRVGDW